MWTKKEVMFIVFSCLISAGVLIYGAINNSINTGDMALSIIAVILSGFCLSIALYMFDDYVEQVKN